ncbi:MAG: ABC transporter substrate-binding protein [Pseudomonadota bacterium]
MRNSIARGALGSLAVTMAVGTMALGWGSYPAAAQDGDRFVMGISSSPHTFHPWDMGQHNSPNHAQFYNRMVKLDKELNPQPDLAESWAFSDDGTVVTLKLREGVKFQSGKELTSEDVKRSWDQITKGEFVGSHANLKPLANLVSEIRTPDPYTVELVYAKPNPAVFDLLDLFFIVDMDQWERHNEHPIGTGPYQLTEFIPGDRLVMEAFDDYWGDQPSVKELEYRVIPDPQALVLNLESGSVDGIIFFPHREVERLRGKGFDVFAANPDGIVFDLLYGLDQEPITDKRVRQAISMMINRDRFHRVIMGGLGEKRCLPWPEYSIAYDAELDATCEFNPEKARALLEEAGYGDGFEVELITSQQMALEQVKFAEMLQNDLKQIGVDVKVTDTDRAGYQSWYRGRKYPLQTHNYGRGNKDPASLYGTATVWKAEGNTQRYSNPEYQRLITEAASTLDEDKRKELYGQLNEMILDEVFISAIHTNPRWFAHSSDWQNIDASVDGFMYFFDMEHQPG